MVNGIKKVLRENPLTWNWYVMICTRNEVQGVYHTLDGPQPERVQLTHSPILGREQRDGRFSIPHTEAQKCPQVLGTFFLSFLGGEDLT